MDNNEPGVFSAELIDRLRDFGAHQAQEEALLKAATDRYKARFAEEYGDLEAVQIKASSDPNEPPSMVRVLRADVIVGLRALIDFHRQAVQQLAGDGHHKTARGWHADCARLWVALELVEGVEVP